MKIAMQNITIREVTTYIVSHLEMLTFNIFNSGKCYNKSTSENK